MNLTETNASQKKILFLPFNIRNKVAANALWPLVFLLELKFEVLEKKCFLLNGCQKGRQCAHKNRESVEAFLRKSKIIDYAVAVGLTGNFLCLSGWASKEVSWEGVFAFRDYETEVIAVWKNIQIRENSHISKTKTENKNHQEGKHVYVSHLSAKNFFVQASGGPVPCIFINVGPKSNLGWT